jgi:RNA polymerase sigma-70 factor (ECF subfamily)
VVSVDRSSTHAPGRRAVLRDRASRRWVEQLHPDHPRHEQAAAWAYKFVIFEASNKVARHAWQHHPPSAEDLTWDQLADTLTPRPGDLAERREQLAALTKAIEHDLTPRQREVFAAIALNDVPIDVLALQLGSNRNAIYKNLFDARRKLRASLAAAGHPLSDEEARS